VSKYKCLGLPTPSEKYAKETPARLMRSEREIMGYWVTGLDRIVIRLDYIRWNRPLDSSVRSATSVRPLGSPFDGNEASSVIAEWTFIWPEPW